MQNKEKDPNVGKRGECCSQSFQHLLTASVFSITETRLTDLETTGVWAAVPQGEDSKRKETNSTQEAWIVPDASYCLKV